MMSMLFHSAINKLNHYFRLIGNLVTLKLENWAYSLEIFSTWLNSISTFGSRYPSFLRVTNVKEAAATIVEAVRRGHTIVFIPGYVYYLMLLIK